MLVNRDAYVRAAYRATLLGEPFESLADWAGRHVIELADGSEAVIPAAQVPAVVQALQWGLAQRVFAQSQQFAAPTESTLALREFHLTDARVATLGRSTNLACNLSEYGWVALLSEDAVLLQMKEKIDEILVHRSASSGIN